jgi:adenosylcobinamide-phosphate synthase
MLNSFTYSALLLYGVFIVKILVSHYIPHDPWFAFRRYCLLLANKVNKSDNSATQQTISGGISVWLTLSPIVIILWLFVDFIEVTWLWHSMLLYLALGSCDLLTKTKKIESALSLKNTSAAKQKLAPLVLRETQNLSNLGLNKACIEMLISRAIQHYFVIACCFLIFGALAAVTMRMLLEMHYSWNIKLQKYRNFGKHIHLLVNLFQWLPVRFLAITMLLIFSLRRTKGLQIATKLHLKALNNDIIHHYFSLILEITLGGAAIYNGEKLRRKGFNKQARQPHFIDIKHTSRYIKQLFMVFTFIIVLLSL